MYAQENITAIATPPGTGGVGILRISGPTAYAEALKLVVGNTKPARPGQMRFAKFVAADGTLVDSGYYVFFQGPASFTGEDVVEFHCHGGMTILTTLLRELLSLDIRPARPGEFSQRAFLNGKIDLVQAEAIMDMIHADSQKALGIALGQHQGKLSAKIDRMRSQVTEVLARLEVSMDYPDIDMETEDWRQTKTVLESVGQQLEALAGSFTEGRLYREGVTTAILGKPNVGKSSLLNLLAGEERAIVTDIPGTTRDVLEIPVNVHGIPLRLLDTAGIRETKDVVEKIGVSRAREAAQQADLVLLMFDLSRPADSDDRRLLELAGKNTIIILNKSDLERSFDLPDLANPAVEISVETGEGIDALKRQVYELFVLTGSTDQNLLTNERHFQCIKQAQSSLNRCLTGWEINSMDILALDLRECWEALGEVVGRVWTGDLLDSIFGQFCLGK